MIVTTIGELLQGRFYVGGGQEEQHAMKACDFQQDWWSTCHFEEHCIYRFRDGTTSLYIGQSKRNILKRVGNHLGLYSMPGSVALQRLILANLPRSYDWLIDFFTLEDCQKRMKMAAGTFAGMTLFEVARQEQIEHTIDFIEQQMIGCYQPCLNLAYNPKPTALPEHYRLPLTEIIDGMVCTSDREPGEYQVSYHTYDYATQQNKRFTVSMYAHSFTECRQMVTYLLGYKPEGLRIHSEAFTQEKGATPA